jgi:O-antigen ligase
MVFPDSVRLEQPLMNSVSKWLGFTFALLAFTLPMVFWFMSKGAIDWVRMMFALFLLGIGQKAPRIYYKDRLIRLCALLILMMVIGYIWQRFSVPEEFLARSSVKKYISVFCFFAVVAYGMNAVPRVSPFLLLISAGLGLLIHLSSVPIDAWLAGWQGRRQAFGFQFPQFAGVVFSTALLAGVIFLPRVCSLPFRARVLALPLLVGLILLMTFGVIATQSRAVWLGLALSAIILSVTCAAAIFTSRYSLRQRTLIRAATIGVGILLVGSAMLYSMNDSINQRLSEETINVTTIKEMAQMKTISTSAGVRIGSWSAACEWIAERPVFGWGASAVPNLIKQSPYFNEKFKSTYGHLHNSYLQTLVNVGGAVFLCMIAIVCLVAWRTVMTWRQGKMPTDVFLFSCAFFFFWVTNNIFEPYVIYPTGFFLNATIGGFVYSWYLRSQHDQA